MEVISMKQKIFLLSIIIIGLIFQSPSVLAQEDDFFPIGLWGLGATPILSPGADSLPDVEAVYLNSFNANCMEHHMLDIVDSRRQASEFYSYEHTAYKNFCQNSQYKMAPTVAPDSGFYHSLIAMTEIVRYKSCADEGTPGWLSILYGDGEIDDSVDSTFQFHAENIVANITDEYKDTQDVVYGYFLGHEGPWYKNRADTIFYSDRTPIVVMTDSIQADFLDGLNYFARRLKEEDPNHKVIILQGIGRIGTVDYEGETVDVFEVIDDYIDVFQHERYTFLVTTSHNGPDFQERVEYLIRGNSSYGACMERILLTDVDMEWEAVIQACEYGGQNPRRRPTMSEMKLQVYLALSRGATGIWYYQWAAHHDLGPGESYIMGDASGSPPERDPFILDQDANPPDVFYFSGLAELNATLQIMGPIFKTLDIQNAVNADSIAGGDASQYITDIDNEISITVDGQEISSIETGIFHDDGYGDFGDEYVVFVNRVCNDSLGAPANPQTFTVHLSGERTYLIEDVLEANTGPHQDQLAGLFYAYGEEVDDVEDWQVTLEPGEGRLFRICRNLHGTIPFGAWRDSVTVAGDVALPALSDTLLIEGSPLHRVDVAVSMCKLDFQGTVLAKYADFDDGDSGAWDRIKIGVNGEFFRCTFEDVACALEAEQGAYLRVFECMFFNYSYEAIMGTDANLNIESNQFYGNSVGKAISADGGKLRLYYNEIYDGSTGLWAENPPDSTFDINGNVISGVYNGIMAYGGAILDINGSNHIINNSARGLTLLNKASASIFNPDSASFETANKIMNNGAEEIYFMAGCALDMDYGYNVISDSLYNPGWTDEYLVYRQPPPIFETERTNHLRRNNWEPDYDENRFQPEGYDRFDIFPVWDGPGGTVPPPKEQYQQAMTALDDGFYEQAETGFKQIVAAYPQSEQALLSLQQLLVLEKMVGNDFAGLRNYYETQPNKDYDQIMHKVSEQLMTYTDVAAGEYPSAIDRLETIVENPPAVEDSIFAIIDIGWVYLKMEAANGDSLAGPLSNYSGRIPGLRPHDAETHRQNTNRLLASLGFVLPLPADDDPAGQTAARPYLAQNYPNPFNPITTIRYHLPNSPLIKGAGGLSSRSGGQGVVSLRIYNITGQLVKTLVDGQQSPGDFSVSWDGRNEGGQTVASGLYFYRLTTENVSISKRMVLLK